MRDPELVVRAQLAASALEGAWHRWRVVHGDMAEPMSAVSSYVGYSLQEPMGQPRVVFGLAAEDAEQLAALIERHDCGGQAYAAAAAQLGVRELSAQAGARAVPAPRQAPLVAANRRVGQSLGDVLLAGENSGYDEPVYRQAAAAMRQAAAARENASRVRLEAAEPADTRLSRDDSGSIAAGRPGLADIASPGWMGALARAASTARAEAEARIKATLTDQDDEPAATSECDADAGDLAAADGLEAGPDDVQAAGADDSQDPGIDDGQDPDGDEDVDVESDAAGRPALPQIYATDVLEPLPTPEVADEADVAGVEEPAAEPSDDDTEQDDQDISDDIPEQDDHEVAASVQSGDEGPGIARRGRVNRSYPIARLSKTKRPGASSRPAGG